MILLYLLCKEAVALAGSTSMPDLDQAENPDHANAGSSAQVTTVSRDAYVSSRLAHMYEACMNLAQYPTAARNVHSDTCNNCDLCSDTT